jgi:hypothetical protein
VARLIVTIDIGPGARLARRITAMLGITDEDDVFAAVVDVGLDPCTDYTPPLADEVNFTMNETAVAIDADEANSHLCRTIV